MLHVFLPKTTRNTLKYHLVTAEPPFTLKTIDWMHQTGPKILLSVTHMFHVNQDCHGVGRCVKVGSCSSSSLSESQWTVLMGYLTISTNVDAIKHSTDDNFSFMKTAHWHLDPSSRLATSDMGYPIIMLYFCQKHWVSTQQRLLNLQLTCRESFFRHNVFTDPKRVC